MDARTHKTIGFGIGLGLTALTFAFILYGKLAPCTVPHHDLAVDRLVVCDLAPAEVRPGAPVFEQAVEFWGRHGYTFDVDRSACTSLCTTDIDDHLVVCIPGAVAIDLMASQRSRANLVGICLHGQVLDRGELRDWATVEVSEGVDMLALTHELGHALGYEHVQGPQMVPGWNGVRFAPPRGHVMHPVLAEAGWGNEGIERR
jgi:hypothetical protein